MNIELIAGEKFSKVQLPLPSQKAGYFFALRGSSSGLP
jgi:hypothetical protein